MNDEKILFLELAIVRQMPYNAIAIEMKKSRKQITDLSKQLSEERKVWSHTRSLWRRKCQSVPFNDFKTWFEKAERKCNYCGVTEPDIKILLENKMIFTKRLKTRGRTLEIERILPNERYDNISNLVYSCYWCNNAKSDEFSIDEFLQVGAALKLIWEARRNSIKTKLQ